MYKLLFISLLIPVVGISQPSGEWVQIRKMAVNGSEDVWVRRESPLEIAARPVPIHDTVYVDSFRNKIWDAWAHLHRYAKPVDTVRYDSSVFLGFKVIYNLQSGYISNGHLSKKRHSMRSRTSEWISGDYYYVIHKSWAGDRTKEDTLKRFSNHEDAVAFFLKRAHRYLSAQFNKAYKNECLTLTLDEHEIRQVNLWSFSYESTE